MRGRRKGAQGQKQSCEESRAGHGFDVGGVAKDRQSNCKANRRKGLEGVAKGVRTEWEHVTSTRLSVHFRWLRKAFWVVFSVGCGVFSWELSRVWRRFARPISGGYGRRAARRRARRTPTMPTRPEPKKPTRARTATAASSMVTSRRSELVTSRQMVPTAVTMAWRMTKGEAPGMPLVRV